MKNPIPEGWRPERKIVAAAAVTVVLYIVGLFGVEVPVEVGASLVTLAGYLIPNPA